MTRLIPDSGIRITSFGVGSIFLCLVVAAAATNTGNNGLYLVLAAMLAGMIVSGIVSRRNVRGVECRIEAIGEIVATRPALLKVRLRSRLSVATAQGLFFLHEGLAGPVWVEPLKPGESREILIEGVFPRRGVVTRADAGLLSRFPFGLFRKYRRASLDREVVVYPLAEVSAAPEVPPEDSRGGRSLTRRRGSGSNIRTLRDFVPGDDPRDVHWKQSARMRHWIVREREAERDRPVVLAVDNAFEDPTDSDALLCLEGRISRCAGQALLLLSRGAEVGFEARGIRIPPAAGRTQRARILEALARLGAVACAAAPAFGPVRPGDLRWLVA